MVQRVPSWCQFSEHFLSRLNSPCFLVFLFSFVCLLQRRSKAMSSFIKFVTGISLSSMSDVVIAWFIDSFISATFTILWNRTLCLTQNSKRNMHCMSAFLILFNSVFCCECEQATNGWQNELRVRSFDVSAVGLCQCKNQFPSFFHLFNSMRAGFLNPPCVKKLS